MPASSSEVRAALREAGIQAGVIDTALLKFVDPSGVIVDDAGFVFGAEAAVSALRDRMPRWFISRPEDLVAQ